MWLRNFINELKAWSIVRKVYKQNKRAFLALNLKCDWFGKLYTVINRDTDIELGSEEDEIYLHKELAVIWNFLVKMNLVDILAYELSPLENEKKIDGDKIEYEHGYLITFTPAWDLSQQYVTWKSVLGLITLGACLGAGLAYIITLINW